MVAVAKLLNVNYRELFKLWKKAYLSHMTAHLDYKDTIKYLDNENYMPAYDGLILDIH